MVFRSRVRVTRGHWHAALVPSTNRHLRTWRQYAVKSLSRRYTFRKHHWTHSRGRIVQCREISTIWNHRWAKLDIWWKRHLWTTLTLSYSGLNSPNVAIAMGNLASAATHCKFEASDSVSDEVVLLKMLQVLQMALISPCGSVLSDEAVCEMMETGLSMCCQMRLSGKWPSDKFCTSRTLILTIQV